MLSYVVLVVLVVVHPFYCVRTLSQSSTVLVVVGAFSVLVALIDTFTEAQGVKLIAFGSSAV